jgi:hypothetical protein
MKPEEKLRRYSLALRVKEPLHVLTGDMQAEKVRRLVQSHRDGKLEDADLWVFVGEMSVLEELSRDVERDIKRGQTQKERDLQNGEGI